MNGCFLGRNDLNRDQQSVVPGLQYADSPDEIAYAHLREHRMDITCPTLDVKAANRRSSHHGVDIRQRCFRKRSSPR